MRPRPKGPEAEATRGYDAEAKILASRPVWQKNTSNVANVPNYIRFATWNIGTMSGRSAEVVETLHRRKIAVYKKLDGHDQVLE